MISPPMTPASPLPTYNDSSSKPSQLAHTDATNVTASYIPTALARFEYEAGHTTIATGTKVLLVEWEDTEDIFGRTGVWTVAWKGRKEVLIANEGGATHADTDDISGSEPAKRTQASAKDSQADAGAPSRPNTGKHRLYFMLPLGTAVPAQVSISFTPAPQPKDLNTTGMASETTSERPAALAKIPQPIAQTSVPTLPAIFPPALCTSATMQGKKGVLHTLWAKSRVNALRAEIAQEEDTNIEGIGLEMARSELDWICENFGVGQSASGPDTPAAKGAQVTNAPAEPQKASNTTSEGLTSLMTNAQSTQSAAPPTPASPSASMSLERFLSKMKGLRVGTSTSDTQGARSPIVNKSSLGQALRAQAASGMPTPPQTEGSGINFAAGKNPLSPEAGDVAVGGFEAIKGDRDSDVARGKRQQPASGRPSTNTIGSLAGVVKSQPQPQASRSTSEDENEDDENDEGLFALPMSPRSPEDVRTSPFSFEGIGSRASGR